MFRKLVTCCLDRRFAVFLAVGAVNAVFGYLVFASFIYVGLHYSVAALLATVIGVLFNFKTTGRLVFKSRDNSLIVRFFGVYALVYVLNILGLAVFNSLGVSNYIAGALILPPAGILTFILLKRLVFSK